MKKRVFVAAALAAVMSVGLVGCGDKETEKQVQDAIETAADEAADAIEDAAEDIKSDLGDSGTETVDMSTAKTQEWGDFTVSVPSGFEFRGGDALDENEKSCCSVKESTFKYFDFNLSDKQNGMNHYNYNKETYTNGQKDVSGTIGDFSWTGFQYEDGFGGYGFELYTEVGDRVLRVSSAGYEFGSAVPEGILGSLHVK